MHVMKRYDTSIPTTIDIVFPTKKASGINTRRKSYLKSQIIGNIQSNR